MKSKVLEAMLISALIGAFGCAGASVQQQSRQAPVSHAHPTHIVIYPFAVDPQEIELNRGFLAQTYRVVATTNEDEKQAEIADDISQTICLDVAADLTQKKYNAVCQKRGLAPIGHNLIVVDGEFNDVSEGNRLSRTIIGFGVGSSTLDTDVYVIHRVQGASKQVLKFTTHADSGKMPGVAVTGAPGAVAGGGAAIASVGVNAAMSAAKAHRSSMSSLAEMTADEITDHLGTYLVQQGWTGGS